MAVAGIRNLVAGRTKMIAAVQPFGCIDQVNHSIRAHIEYVP